MTRANLDLARQHLADAEKKLEAQRQLVDRMAADGHDTTLARNLLQTFEQALKAMQGHLAVEEKYEGDKQSR